ncbi:LysR family transcriptional regulator [Mycobacteroides abscessus]|uniref:LysR family transcriptional regulator n=1 Tax=Mycobacteroides abscessus TaxID=36809 RepID=UPI000926D357|nr:LysR family transcriptional regulator [Mycobacteroides abscessus]SHQ89371.1 HTH-type transcriptional regulator YwbI [Mycobacteroides abscessus subsp. bolletii]SHR73608.1 HTH-type transcriptional regulator YwbI [Mycobacteroides abscessus subsp. bolletii]SHT16921.1 HTH-type transcriptional regulator YwbI [Mycobacteroides abscessus subsp. bolletii]SKG06017.1 HTH-type transcriptional regulator YwbI [Mycobacteroides abscessus subsp. bolletii]SKG72779.1 HTH-type transcriptional regulator YwbI [My
MDLRGLEMYDLRCFIAVATRLNFTRAARDLRMSTPPLSRRIRDMERVLNTKLFLRDTRRVALTPAGANLLPVAQKLLDQFERLPEVVADNDPHSRQRIICGVPPWLHLELKAKLSRLDEIYAERLTLIDRRCRSSETIASILRKDLAFGFVRPFTGNPALDSVVVHQEKIGAVLCKSKYGLRTSIPLQELLGLDYVTDRRDSDTEYRHQVDSAMESAGMLRRARISPGDHAGGAAAIRTGNAFATAPLSTASSPGYNATENVCLPIEGLDFTLTTCLVWSKNLAENDRTARDVIDTAIALCRGARALPRGDSA